MSTCCQTIHLMFKDTLYLVLIVQAHRSEKAQEKNKVGFISNQQQLIQRGVKMSGGGDIRCQHDTSGDRAEMNVNEVSRLC